MSSLLQCFDYRAYVLVHIVGPLTAKTSLPFLKRGSAAALPIVSGDMCCLWQMMSVNRAHRRHLSVVSSAHVPRVPGRAL